MNEPTPAPTPAALQERYWPLYLMADTAVLLQPPGSGKPEIAYSIPQLRQLLDHLRFTRQGIAESAVRLYLADYDAGRLDVGPSRAPRWTGSWPPIRTGTGASTTADTDTQTETAPDRMPG